MRTRRRPVAITLCLALICGVFIVSAAPARAAATIFLKNFGSHGTGPQNLYHPYDIDTDRETGDVYVVDHVNHRIQKFKADGTFVQTIGNGYGQDDGQLNYPQAVAYFSPYVYVADTANNRVVQFGSTGDFIRDWGEAGSGEGQLNFPQGITTDLSGNVYVLDTRNARVQKFSPSGTFQDEFGGSGTDDGEFIVPSGIEFDGENLYVSDEQRSDVQVLSTSGDFVGKLGGENAAPLNYPDEITACDADDEVGGESVTRVYVTESGTHQVSIFEGMQSVGAITGGGTDGFDFPHGVACTQLSSYTHDLFITASNSSFIAKYRYSSAASPKVNAVPDKRKAPFLDGKLKFRLSHKDISAVCQLSSATAKLKVPADPDNPVDTPNNYSIKGSGATVRPGAVTDFSMPVPKKVVKDAKAAFDDGRKVSVAANLDFGGCEGDKVDYKVPG